MTRTTELGPQKQQGSGCSRTEMSAWCQPTLRLGHPASTASCATLLWEALSTCRAAGTSLLATCAAACAPTIQGGHNHPTTVG